MAEMKLYHYRCCGRRHPWCSLTSCCSAHITLIPSTIDMIQAWESVHEESVNFGWTSTPCSSCQENPSDAPLWSIRFIFDEDPIETGVGARPYTSEEPTGLLKPEMISMLQLLFAAETQIQYFWGFDLKCYTDLDGFDESAESEFISFNSPDDGDDEKDKARSALYGEIRGHESDDGDIKYYDYAEDDDEDEDEDEDEDADNSHGDFDGFVGHEELGALLAYLDQALFMSRLAIFFG